MTYDDNGDRLYTRDEVNDIMADHYHPEFGSEWMPPYGDQPAGSLYRHTVSVAGHAWKEGYYAGYNDHRAGREADPETITPWKDNQ